MSALISILLHHPRKENADNIADNEGNDSIGGSVIVNIQFADDFDGIAR